MINWFSHLVLLSFFYIYLASGHFVRFCIGFGHFTLVFPGKMPIFLVDFHILSILRLLSEREVL